MELIKMKSNVLFFKYYYCYLFFFFFFSNAHAKSKLDRQVMDSCRLTRKDENKKKHLKVKIACQFSLKKMLPNSVSVGDT